MTQVQEAEPQARQTMSALPQPVIRQAVMAVPIVADLVILLSRGDLGKLSPYYAVGIAVFFAATVVSAVLPRHVSSAGLILVIPFLDLGAIGLMRLVPDGNGLGLLAVLPAMWLAVDLRLRGVVLALVGILGLITVPSLLYFGYEASWWSRGLLIPIISTMVGLTAVGTVQVWSRQNQELEEQGKRLEEALRQTTEDRALNEAVVKAVDIGLVALDRTGAYRYVNPKQQGFLDLAFPEGHLGRAGQTGFVFAPDRVRRMVPEDMPSTRAMKGEEFTDHLMWVGEDPATQKALSVSATPVRDAAGQFNGAVLAYKDVTDLMAALRIKDEFVASVSHELRTPLTSIMGFLDLVLDEDDISTSVRRNLDVVKRNSERLLRLIGDLLLAAQVDQGHIPLDRRDTDITALLGQAVTDLTPYAHESGIDVEVELSEAVTMFVDPGRLRQVVDNLLSNAIKYTARGGAVHVAVRREPDQVRIEVADDGIGIAPEDLGLLFDRFFRAQEAQIRAIQGIGLGLAISNAIVEAHGGHIEVDSAAGKGSTFAICLPLPRGSGAEGPATGSVAWDRDVRV